MLRYQKIRLYLNYLPIGLFGIICLLFISNNSYAKSKSKKNIYNQYDDTSKPKIVIKKKKTTDADLKKSSHLESQTTIFNQGILNSPSGHQVEQTSEQNSPQKVESKESKEVVQNLNKENTNLQNDSNQRVNQINPNLLIDSSAQVIKIEKHVELADVDTSKLNYVPWRVQFNLGTSQVSIQDSVSKSNARLLSDVNYSLNTQYYIPINKTNQLSVALTNHLEKYKNFSSRIQLSNVSFFRNDVKFNGHRVIQNELVLRYGLAMKQSLVAYALNTKFIELQNVPQTTIEIEIEDQLFEYDLIHLYANFGLDLQLSARTQDYTIASGNSFYLGVQIKNKKIKNPSLLGFTFRQQNLNTSVSTQLRSDMNFSVGAEF